MTGASALIVLLAAPAAAFIAVKGSDMPPVTEARIPVGFTPSGAAERFDWKTWVDRASF